MDTPHSVSETYTESFLGEAAIVLLAEMEAEWVRELAALGIMAFHYTSTRSVMRQAFRHRAQLEDDYARAVNLLICWSGLRWVANFTERTNQTGQAVFERAGRRLVNAFVKKYLPVALIPLPRIAAISRRLTERIDARNPAPWARRFQASQVNREEDREVDRPHYWLDTDVLSHGFCFLGALTHAYDARDRATMLAYNEALLSLFTTTMPRIERPNQEVEGTPYEFDHWVLRLTAAIIAQLPSEKEARPFWQPIVDLGPGAHYWIESFFHDWFLTGRQYAPSVEEFGARCKEMIAYSFEAPTWSGTTARSYWLEECSIELMGLGLMLDIIATDEFIPVIQALAPHYERWGKEWLSHSRPASHFAYYLSRPGGPALLPSAIIWLNRGVQSMSDYGWDQKDLADNLSGALRACWRHYRSIIASDAGLQQHFLQLLNTLCNRLNADALALRTEVSQFISIAS